jgi:hypothetical protein
MVCPVNPGQQLLRLAMTAATGWLLNRMLFSSGIMQHAYLQEREILSRILE